MTTSSDPQSGKTPACPKCNATLVRKGKIGDVGFVKKWIEYWSCPTHGEVELPGGSGAKPKGKK